MGFCEKHVHVSKLLDLEIKREFGRHNRVQVSVFLLLSRNGVNEDRVVGKLPYCKPLSCEIWLVLKLMDVDV